MTREYIDQGKIFERLLHLAMNRGLIVRFAPLRASNGRIMGERIGLRQDMGIEEINQSLAHELAHSYLHFDQGDILNSPIREKYEQEAERAADMLLDILYQE